MPPTAEDGSIPLFSAPGLCGVQSPFCLLIPSLAMGSGVTLMSSQLDFVPALTSTVFVGLTLGLPMGLVQWYLLKQQGLSATFWPLLTVLGYTLSFGIVVYLSGEGREWLVLTAMGLVLGLITGLGMMRRHLVWVVFLPTGLWLPRYAQLYLLSVV